MSNYTNPNFTVSKVDEFSDDENRRYATFLWDCVECGQRTCTDSGGGVLNPCLKKECADQHCGNDGHSLLVTQVIGGHAHEPRSVASMEGRKPGEPARENAWQRKTDHAAKPQSPGVVSTPGSAGTPAPS